MDGYYERFWALLQGVHELDSHPWPSDIPTASDDPSFEFSFAGMPMFVVANTPAHEKRQSRYFEYFAITFQPRFVFDDISAQSPQGQNARKIIRSRLTTYDAIPQTPLLGNFGETGNQEWRQYFLQDHNESLPANAQCPFHVAVKETAMPADPQFDTTSPPPLSEALVDLLPTQGSFELQQDQPGKTHSWHQHNVDEELHILSGDVVLFWVTDDGEYRERSCGEGTRITLPAGTRHGSTAGSRGVVYIIRPRDGQAAVTTFLTPEEHPFPAPSPAT